MSEHIVWLFKEAYCWTINLGSRRKTPERNDEPMKQACHIFCGVFVIFAVRRVAMNSGCPNQFNYSIITPELSPFWRMLRARDFDFFFYALEYSFIVHSYVIGDLANDFFSTVLYVWECWNHHHVEVVFLIPDKIAHLYIEMVVGLLYNG